MEWEAVDFTVVGPWSIGYIYVDNLQMGDYTLGVWDISVSTEETNMEGHDNIFKAFPNPSSGKFNFAISDDNASRLEIYSFDGKLLEQIELKDRSSEVSWIPGNIPDGTYIAVLRSNNKKALASKKIVYIK